MGRSVFIGRDKTLKDLRSTPRLPPLVTRDSRLGVRGRVSGYLRTTPNPGGTCRYPRGTMSLTLNHTWSDLRIKIDPPLTPVSLFPCTGLRPVSCRRVEDRTGDEGGDARIRNKGPSLHPRLPWVPGVYWFRRTRQVEHPPSWSGTPTPSLLRRTPVGES